VWETEHRDALDEDLHVCASIGALLVQTPQHTVMVDTGMGDRQLEIELGRTGGGSFLTNLRTIGVDPETVDAVVYTHLHLDHVGWTTVKDGDGYRLLFPNAEHCIDSAEWTYWAGRNEARGMPLEAMERPIADRLRLLDDRQRVVPGVAVLHAPGHTPGHALVVISSGNERAIVTGDSVHSPAQIHEHTWECVSDVDPALARSTRETLFDELLKPRTLGVGSHFPNSVFGRAILSERRMHWVGWDGG